MSGRLFRLLAPLASGAVLGLSACHPAAPEALGVEGAWVRLAAMPDRPAAGYFVIRGGATADRLVGVTSTKAARIELHAGGMHGGMATMHAIAGIAIAAGGEAKLAPGGDHAMLFGIDPKIRPGDTLPLTLRFASGATVTAAAKTIAVGDPAPGADAGEK